jgi:hypothetical protein
MIITALLGVHLGVAPQRPLGMVVALVLGSAFLCSLPVLAAATMISSAAHSRLTRTSGSSAGRLRLITSWNSPPPIRPPMTGATIGSQK